MSVNIQFKLKKTKSIEVTSIRLVFYLNGERYMYGTDKKIHPELWDAQNQMPFTIKRTNSKSLKEVLAEHKKLNHNLESELKTIITRLDNLKTYTKMYLLSVEENMGKPSKQDYKAYMDSKVKISRASKVTKIDTVEYLSQFIDDMRSGKRLIRSGQSIGKTYSNGTIGNYCTLKAKLMQYKKYKSLPKLYFEDISLDFYDAFLKFVITEQDKASNYFGSLIKNIKSMCRWAQDEGVHSFEDYKKKAFVKLQEEVDKEYLSEEELTAIYELKLEKGSKLDMIRDVFLCGCYTAQRFGDYSRIQRKYINLDDGTIELAQNKGGVKVIIPIAVRVQEILLKYDYDLPDLKLYDINIYIKEIAKRSGITQKVITTESKQGQRIEVEVEKYKLITSHTARRTGCTLMDLSGLSLNEIRLISGHKSIKTLQLYLKTTSKQNAKKVGSNKFFQG